MNETEIFELTKNDDDQKEGKNKIYLLTAKWTWNIQVDNLKWKQFTS